jgi:hypothetical protein
VIKIRRYNSWTDIEGNRRDLREILNKLPDGLQDSDPNMDRDLSGYNYEVQFYTDGFHTSACGKAYIPACPVMQYINAKDKGFVSILFAEKFKQWIAISDHTKRISHRDEDGEPYGGVGFGPTDIRGPTRLTKEMAGLIGEAYGLDLKHMKIDEIEKLAPSELERMAQKVE